MHICNHDRLPTYSVEGSISLMKHPVYRLTWLECRKAGYSKFTFFITIMRLGLAMFSYEVGLFKGTVGKKSAAVVVGMFCQRRDDDERRLKFKVTYNQAKREERTRRNVNIVFE